MRTPNSEQQKVVEQLNSNILLFASAGTGKTFTVANRVNAILNSGLCCPGEILCLTFTVKASGEMQDDIEKYSGGKNRGVEVKTIHGFCYSIIKEEGKKNAGKYSDLFVADDVDQQEIALEILRDNYYTWTGEYDLCAQNIESAPKFTSPIFERKGALRNFVSALKHKREEKGLYSDNAENDFQQAFEMIKEDEKIYNDLVSYYSRWARGFMIDRAFERAMQNFAGKFLVEYDKKLALSNLVDYDDLILLSKRYLQDNTVRERWANKYKYIIVDEMQDTSLLEYSLLVNIFAKNNVMLCGDFFQTIYGWRGSAPEKILDDFSKQFKPKTYMLKENYRSTRTLTSATFDYLKNTYPDFVGKFCPEEIVINSADDGEKIVCYAFKDAEEEAVKIYEYILKRNPENYDDICVIARTNNYLATLSAYFERFNESRLNEGAKTLKFFTVEKDYQFFKKSVVKDFLSVVKLCINADDLVSFERLAQKYINGVGDRTLENLRQKNKIGVSLTTFLDEDTYKYGDAYYPLIEGKNKDNIVVFDTETTGLDLEHDQIIQLSAIKINNGGKVIDSLEFMIEPSVAISDNALKTHGFDLEFIRSNNPLKPADALKRFSSFVKGCVLVGHNSAQFDLPLLNRELNDNGLKPLEIIKHYDTLKIAKQFYGELKDYKLSTLCEKFGVKNLRAHDATSDITATAECLIKMLDFSVIPTTLGRINAIEKNKEKFFKFFSFIRQVKDKIKTTSAKEVATFIIEGFRLKEKYKTEEQTLNDLILSFENAGTETEKAFRDYITSVSFAGSQMDMMAKRFNKVPLITVHQAKGCEFDTVIIAGAFDGNFPTKRAKGTSAEDEEKKIFYVAITRAKKRLILTRPIEFFNQYYKRTPFFDKFPKEYVNVNKGWIN